SPPFPYTTLFRSARRDAAQAPRSNPEEVVDARLDHCRTRPGGPAARSDDALARGHEGLARPLALEDGVVRVLRWTGWRLGCVQHRRRDRTQPGDDGVSVRPVLRDPR